jgi:hypothetical protein
MSEKNIILDGSGEPYVRLEDLAKFLDVKADTIADWCKRYENFPHLVLPGSIRVRVSGVEAWLKTIKLRPGAKKTQKEEN